MKKFTIKDIVRNERFLDHSPTYVDNITIYCFLVSLVFDAGFKVFLSDLYLFDLAKDI